MRWKNICIFQEDKFMTAFIISYFGILVVLGFLTNVLNVLFIFYRWSAYNFRTKCKLLSGLSVVLIIINKNQNFEFFTFTKKSFQNDQEFTKNYLKVQSGEICFAILEVLTYSTQKFRFIGAMFSGLKQTAQCLS